MEYTEDELADLTPEERAALEENTEGDDDNKPEDGENADNGSDKTGSEAGENSGDNGAQNNNGEQQKTNDSQVENGTDNGTDNGKPDENGQQPPRDDGKDAGKDVATPSTATQIREPAPVLIVEAPKDSDKQLKEIKEQKIALADQFDEGDITNREYQQKLDELNQQERKIERDIDRARLSEEMEAQRKNNAWNDAQADFMADHPEYEDETRREMFNAVFRTVANREEFSSLPVTRANSLKLLRAAHDAFVSVTGAPVSTDKNAEKTANANQQQKKNIPPTLSGLPSAEVNDTNSGRWASLDRLREKNYQEYEDKLFSMSDADRDAYLADR